MLSTRRTPTLAVLSCAVASLLLVGCMTPLGPGPAESSVSAAPPSESAAPSVPDLPSSESPLPEQTDAVVEMRLLDARFDAEAGAIVVSSMVPGLVASGSCSLRVSMDERSFEGVVEATVDASVTYCASVAVVLPADPSGGWSFEMVFTSDGTRGQVDGEVVVA